MRNLILITIAVLLFAACGGNSERKGGKQQQPPVPATSVPQPKPTVNVYIENSGSMDGYVKGVTEFKNAVYNYLSDIMISGVSNSLNLFYINSEIIEHGSDISDFIEKLEPSTFRDRGGNRSKSDIAGVIESVLSKTQENTVSVLVTDGIFSPGNGRDAAEYLINQQIGIKRRFADYRIKYPNSAVIVYQLSSTFQGTYYDKTDTKIQINEQRPFYIYIIGDAEQLTKLRNKVPDSKFKGSGVQHVFTAMKGNQSVKYAIHPSIGKFKKSRINNLTIIENLKKDSRSGEVKFAVDVDFSGLLLDENYLLNTNNYENSSKYRLEIKPGSIKNNGYSHLLTFTADKVHPKGPVTVKLKAKLPDWVEQVNDDDGATAAKGKTYGIKYQIGGIYDAFTFKDNYYAEIKININ